MDLKEKLVWLYDKLEELTGIVYDMEHPNKDTEIAISRLWNSFNSTKRLEFNLKGD